MAGVGRGERDALVGIVQVDGNGVPTQDPPLLATKAQVAEQLVDLNTRHIRAVAQNVVRFNTAGERTVFPPYFGAVLAAGMQAGSPIGVSLTNKFINVLDFGQDSSWNPVDDAEELIQGGLLFMETVQGVGTRWVRNVTTFLQSDNLAFTEGSVNEAVNFTALTVRDALEFAVGRRGFAGTLNALRGIAINTLNLLVDEGVIVQWRALSLELSGDVVEVSVEVSPTLPINFVRTTLHLTTTTLSA